MISKLTRAYHRSPRGVRRGDWGLGRPPEVSEAPVEVSEPTLECMRGGLRVVGGDWPWPPPALSQQLRRVAAFERLPWATT